MKTLSNASWACSSEALDKVDSEDALAANIALDVLGSKALVHVASDEQVSTSV